MGAARAGRKPWLVCALVPLPPDARSSSGVQPVCRRPGYVAGVEQRISLVTLGVADLTQARTFYERLGWQGQQVEETVFFQTGGIALVLWGRDPSTE